MTVADITGIIGTGRWTADYTYHDNGDMYKRAATGNSGATFTYIGNLMDTATGGESFTLSNPFMFTGQWYDDEIDEYYLRARMYDP